jgi:poly-gamma-glutamate capsule biosynthesis protein CapA/YwtB (metallophosphatase superfamily)
MREEMIGEVDDSAQSTDALSIVLTGDLVLDVPQPAHWLSGIAPALKAADLVIGHLEVPHTRRGVELAGDVPAPGADPAHLAALVEAGFHAVTLAGNHIADCGPQGIDDTIEELERLGIAHAGAGRDLAAARRPAVLERRGRRLAVLSYNCVGPEAGWADRDRAGCAYLRVQTADGAPVTPAGALRGATAEAVDTLRDDIAQARRLAHAVIVALHKGIVHTPARLAEYERPLAQAAIDAGADAVVSHHAHIIRGIEFHRGRPIYHGLGNGCVVTHALSPGQDHPARAAWVLKRKQLFGFEPDPAYTLAPFHPQAVNAMLGRLIWHADGRMETGLVPVHVEAPGRPVLASAARAAEIRDYVVQITRDAGLPPLRLQPRADMTVVG